MAVKERINATLSRITGYYLTTTSPAEAAARRNRERLVETRLRETRQQLRSARRELRAARRRLGKAGERIAALERQAAPPKMSPLRALKEPADAN